MSTYYYFDLVSRRRVGASGRVCLEHCVYIIAWVHGFFIFKQKTAYELRISDWSSDVCSSDLLRPLALNPTIHAMQTPASLSLSPTPDAVPQAMAWLEAVAEQEHWDPRTVFKLSLCLDEALTTIVMYGFTGRAEIGSE